MNFNYYYIDEQFVKKNVLGIKNLGVLLGKAEPLDRDLGKAKLLDKNLRQPLSILGDGYYHGITFFINKNLGIESDLILVDYHSDYSKLYKKIGCSDWVGPANWTNHYLKKLKGKILNIGMSKRESDLNVNNYIVSARNNLKKELEQLKDEIYLSIDLDAIKYEKIGRYYCPELPNKDWINNEKGGLKFSELMDYLKIIKKSKKIIGMDICGHKPQFFNNEYGCEGNLTQMALMINVFTNEADENKLYENFNKKHESFAGFFELKKICQFNKWLKNQEIL
jgi:hypothetical protein